MRLYPTAHFASKVIIAFQINREDYRASRASRHPKASPAQPASCAFLLRSRTYFPVVAFATMLHTHASARYSRARRADGVRDQTLRIDSRASMYILVDTSEEIYE